MELRASMLLYFWFDNDRSYLQEVDDWSVLSPLSVQKVPLPFWILPDVCETVILPLPTYIYIYIYRYIVHLSLSLYVCIYIYIYTRMYVCVHIYIYICMYVCVYVYVYMCVYIYICIYIYIYIYICILRTYEAARRRRRSGQWPRNGQATTGNTKS